MNLDHSTIETLLAVQALGGLDGDDLEELARERAAHGECAECRRLEDGFAETAGRLAFALTPQPVDEAMADRILADGEPTIVIADEVVSVAEPTATGRDDDDLSLRRTRRGRGLQVLVAFAACLTLVVLAVALFGPGRRTTVSDASPTQQIVAFEGEGGGELAMAYTPGQAGAVLFGSNLPDPGPGNVYEIWMFRDGRPISGGCVSPRAGVLAAQLDADLGTSEAMAVTVEPSECPSAPTRHPILTAELPTVA